MALPELDSANIISIDVCFSYTTLPTEPYGLLSQINHDVRPDSMLILQAAREVVEKEGFDDLLDSVRARIDEIESLHRTRELTVCSPALHHLLISQVRSQFKDVDSGDHIRLTVDKGGWRNIR